MQRKISNHYIYEYFITFSGIEYKDIEKNIEKLLVLYYNFNIEKF